MIGAIVAGLAVALFLWAWHAGRDLTRLRRRNEHAAAFYRSAGKLLAIKDVPPLVVRSLDTMGWAIRSRKAPSLFWSFVTRRRSVSPKEAAAEVEMRELARARPEIARLFDETLVQGLLALSYTSPFHGVLLRRLILFDVTDFPERAPPLVDRVALAGHAPAAC